MSGLSESDYSSDESGFSVESEPPWQEEVAENGELFYVEDDRSIDAVTLHHEELEELEKGASRENSTPHERDNRQGVSGQRPVGRQRSPTPSSALSFHNKNSTEDNKGNVPRIKTVFISVQPPSTYGVESSLLLKEMLGIISLRQESGSYRFSEIINEDSLIISAMTSGSPAFRSESIEIGDVLLAINNVAVSRSNIEQVLQRIPHRMELSLTIHCRDPALLRVNSITANSKCHQRNVQVSLEMLKTSNTDFTGSKLDPFHAVFYLTLNVDSETAKGEEDIIYMYPKDSLGIRKLKSARGVFTTLADVATDAFKSKVRSSVVFVNEELVHCMYYRNNSEVLVMCIPGTSSFIPSLHSSLHKTIRLLQIMYGSITKAFESSNFLRLNHLFYLTFSTMSQAHDFSSTSFCGIKGPFGGVEALKIDDSLLADIDCSLSEFEAADFDDGLHSRASTRRLYSILGTSLFYKGHLISSHIPDDDLKDVLTFCHCYCLFSVPNVGRILIWREIFPTRCSRPRQNTSFKETIGRYFYLLIGLRQCLLYVLLESGGCSLSVEPKPRPPLLYINHATAVILNLEKLGLLRKIDSIIFGPQVPATSRIDAWIKKSTLFGGSTDKPPSGSTQPNAAQSPVKLPFWSSPKKMADSSGNEHELKLGAKGSAMVSGVHPEQEDKYVRLTAGGLNTLFFFVDFDVLSGVLLINKDHSRPDGLTHNSIVQSFHATVVVLHDRLSSMREKYPSQNVYEEGSMFLWSKFDRGMRKGKSGNSLLQCWVIGRCVTEPRLKEFYVCYHDWVRQDTVELAFRLGFGIAG